ncbi:hypothetical protein Nepgr_032694 [Nepenthes gracilis]|uniref:Pentatricopeptide repeat-containing protein n=1 Tax=Nepenthes gracilis TaxID=150966 RepID=A0AAD3TKK0_NEPGR|nr:hypothetical protein Nepgr_032694 [Nepenthes gracilis]
MHFRRRIPLYKSKAVEDDPRIVLELQRRFRLSRVIFSSVTTTIAIFVSLTSLPNVFSPLTQHLVWIFNTSKLRMLNSRNLGYGFSVSAVNTRGGRSIPFEHHFHSFSEFSMFNLAEKVFFPCHKNSNSVVLKKGLSISDSSNKSSGGCVLVCPHHYSFSPFLQFGFHKRMLILKYGGFYRAFSNEISGSDGETDCDDGGVYDDDDGREGEESDVIKLSADVKEVDRVCKVIEELFALDHNMEAVLDECGIHLTNDLVVDVLQRFKHARNPAFRFFCWAGKRPGFSHDSRTYNAMLRILGKTRQFETMVSMLNEMGEKKLLTMETFTIAIQAFGGAKERKKAVGIFELMKKHRFKVGVETINSLLDSLGREKLGKEAQALYDKLEGRFTPNLRTYSVLLNGWCRVKNLMEAGRIWNEMIDKGFRPDVAAHNTMLEGLLKANKRSDAIKMFEVMKIKGPAPNVRSYTILIRRLCRQNKMTEAVEFFEEMLNSGCEPDAAIYTCLITGFGNQRRMDKVYGLLKEMKEKGCPPDVQTYNALIKLLSNRRMPDDAVRIYKKMLQCGIRPTIHTYNMMMKSYFVTGNYEMGRAVWAEMACKGCCPDDNSYTVLIGGLVRQGRSEEACRHMEEMIAKGMKVPQLDYNKFAADFSRSGRPNILEELAQKMKFSGKFEVSEVFARWADMMKKRVKRRDPVVKIDR